MPEYPRRLPFIRFFDVSKAGPVWPKTRTTSDSNVPANLVEALRDLSCPTSIGDVADARASAERTAVRHTHATLHLSYLKT